MPLTNLLRDLSVAKTGVNRFKGPTTNLGWGRVFGGQVVSQAMAAARQTIPGAHTAESSTDRMLQSCQTLFIRPGSVKEDIEYVVEPLRDGTTFSFRRVTALQSSKPIFEMHASFQAEEMNHAIDHQDTMPDLGKMSLPETLSTIQEHHSRPGVKIPPVLRTLLLGEQPFEVRPVEFINLVQPEKRVKPNSLYWFRANGSLKDEPESVHRELLAYFSDFRLLGTALLPHGLSVFSPGMQAATITHSVYYHRKVDLNEWHLYEMTSPNLSDSKGLAAGKFFNIHGDLVATAVQEGLLRLRD